MFFIIIATIINSANAQVGASIHQASSTISNQNNQNNQNSAVTNKYGNTLQEEYTDSDGNIKKRSYRYGFQYKDSFKPAKPSGVISKESYTNPSGDQSSRSYRYGWQYKSGEEAYEAPIKMKAQKLNAPMESTGESAGAAASSDSSPSSSAAPSASSSAPSLVPSADDIKRKDADIMNRMKDLIKERQQLKSGK